MKAAYMKISLAEEAEKHSKYKAAFELYRDAVELLLSVRGGKICILAACCK